MIMICKDVKRCSTDDCYHAVPHNYNPILCGVMKCAQLKAGALLPTCCVVHVEEQPTWEV